MVTITLTGESIADIRAQMQDFLGPQESTMLKMMPLATEVVNRLQETMPIKDIPGYEEETPANDFDLDVTPAKEEPKKRTRRTKAEIEAEKLAGQKNEATPIKTAAPSQVAAPGYSREHVHQALQQVNVAVGLPKSREILQSFGANRISEIKEEHFKSFVDKCNEAVMLQG